MKSRVMSGVLMMSLALVGCGELEDADVEATEGAWSEANCTIATADATFTGGVAPTYVSPSSYSNPRCGKAVVIDMNQYSSRYSGQSCCFPETDGRTEVVWNGSAPTTQSACAAMWMGAILYRQTNGVWTEQVRREAEGGRWILNPLNPLSGQFVCFGPTVAFHTAFTPDLVVGRNYRMAVTARTKNTTAASTRSVRISSVMREEVR